MKEKSILTDSEKLLLFNYHDELAQFINSRCDSFFLKGKKRLDEISNITVGAVMMLDILNGKTHPDNNESCISPLIFFSIMRGDDWTKEWERIKSQSQSNNQTSGESGSEKGSL